MKKTILIMIFCALVLSLASCGKDTETLKADETMSETTTVSETSTETTETTTTSAETTTTTVTGFVNKCAVEKYPKNRKSIFLDFRSRRETSTAKGGLPFTGCRKKCYNVIFEGENSAYF